MTKNLLPPLNDDHQVPEISIEGEWTEETNSILARISNGLKSAKLEQDSEELVSVPDVWARTAVVQMLCMMSAIHYITKSKVSGEVCWPCLH